MSVLKLPEDLATFQYTERSKKLTFFVIQGTVINERDLKTKPVEASSTSTPPFLKVSNVPHHDQDVVTLPRIARKTNNVRQFYIRGEAGNEYGIRIHNCSMPIEDGHKMSFVCAVPEGASVAEFAMALDNETKDKSLLQTRVEDDATGDLLLGLASLLMILLGVLMSLRFISAVDMIALSGLALFVVGTTFFVQYRARLGQHKEFFRQHIEKIDDFIFSQDK